MNGDNHNRDGNDEHVESDPQPPPHGELPEVNLEPAWSWKCPRCQTTNYIADTGTMQASVVTCCLCNTTYESNEPIEEIDDDETSTTIGTMRMRTNTVSTWTMMNSTTTATTTATSTTMTTTTSTTGKRTRTIS